MLSLNYGETLSRLAILGRFSVSSRYGCFGREASPVAAKPCRRAEIYYRRRRFAALVKPLPAVEI